MALPALKPTLSGALAWGLLMAASAWLAMSRTWETPERIREVVVLFGIGGVIAFPAGLYVARLIALGRTFETALAAGFLAFAFATMGVTAALYALQYRIYYAQWHADTLSMIWVFEFIFTTLSAFYQFAVLGVRMYLPLGFAALVAASLWFARQPR